MLSLSTLTPYEASCKLRRLTVMVCFSVQGLTPVTRTYNTLMIAANNCGQWKVLRPGRAGRACMMLVLLKCDKALHCAALAA